MDKLAIMISVILVSIPFGITFTNTLIGNMIVIFWGILMSLVAIYNQEKYYKILKIKSK
jgi:hypothetical protein